MPSCGSRARNETNSVMDIEGRTVLILGGTGLVGTAAARQLLEYSPSSIVLCGLTREEADAAAADLQRDPQAGADLRIGIEWGDIFLPESLKDRRRADILADPSARARLLDDLYGELSDDVVRRSALGSLILRWRPDIVVDCVNTATAFAYQNIFNSAITLREQAAASEATLESVESHLATLYLPQMIRHAQIALESMRRAGTKFYVKIGTAGTGGMGLNIPFTHSEERPSRMLLAKAGVAGAHTLLLYLMARTPGAPAVKEIKPTAAISWKRIAFGPITRRGEPIPCHDATAAVPIDRAFPDRTGSDSSIGRQTRTAGGGEGEGEGTAAANRAGVTRSGSSVEEDALPHRPVGRSLEGVFLDAGENGLFSLAEFEALTALGSMEYITPEEIAQNVVREIRGHPTGRDIVGALDAATSGPTYRAGVLREAVLARMTSLEREHGTEAIAFEMLGPPRLSKLLFEGAILARLFPDLRSIAALDPGETAQRAEALIRVDDDLRIRILSIGLPILLPDGAHVLRGPEVKLQPEPGQRPDDARLVDNGWVDLRPSSWRRWSRRAAGMLAALEDGFGADMGSRLDIEPEPRRLEVRPGAMAAWVFRNEDRGGRIKR